MRRLLLDLLVPSRCPGCGVPATTCFCASCAPAAERLVLSTADRTVLARDVLAVGLFTYGGVVRSAIRRMKVDGAHASAPAFGRLMRSRLDLPGPDEGVTVTWVPASRARRRARGADLPELLAGGDAVRLLRRTASRPDQTRLTPQQRRMSPQGSFAAVTSPPPAVVLIDDVRTTGATVTAAAQTLRDAGAARVLVATLAVAGRSPALRTFTGVPVGRER